MPARSREIAVVSCHELLNYIVRRLLLAVLTVWAISVLSFMIIHLPPGDYVTSYIASMSASGSAVSEREAQALREQLGLNQSITVQYSNGWASSFREISVWRWNGERPVSDVIGDRLTLTMVISVAAIIFTWGLALPIGIYSAVYPYSFLDYVFTFVSFIGLAIPGFLLALMIMYVGFRLFRGERGRPLFARFRRAPGAWRRCGTSQASADRPSSWALPGTAQLIRIMRSNLLDELRNPM